MAPIRTATIDIIGRCQNRCTFCYNRNKKGTVDFAHFKDIVESLPSLERANIGGGEPFLNRHLLRMAIFALSRDIHVDISTNGLADPDKVSRLSVLFPGRVGLQINLPAADERAYNAMTRTEGNFGIAMKNIRRLALIQPGIRLKLTLCRENLDQLDAVCALSRELGIPLYIDLMLPAHGASAHLITAPEAMDAYMRILQMKMLQRQIYPNWSFAGASCPVMAETYGFKLKEGRCQAERGEKIYINADGSQRRCEFLG